MKGKFLINTDDYFVAPDGLQYKAVWGDCETVPAKEALGFDPNRNSANWFVKVGTPTDYVLIAGCRIHYATACPERPNTEGTTQDFGEGAKDRSSYIYVPGDAKYHKCPVSEPIYMGGSWVRDMDGIQYNRHPSGRNKDLVDYFLKNEPDIKRRICPNELQNFEDWLKDVSNCPHSKLEFISIKRNDLGFPYLRIRTDRSEMDFNISL